MATQEINQKTIIRLRDLYIRNFRGIEEININLDDCNFFIGNNGTGKTTILAAISRLMPILRGEDRIFLDADFYFKNTFEVNDIKLIYSLELDNSVNKTDNFKIYIEIEGVRKNNGLNHSHLNAQTPAETKISIKDEEGNDVSILLEKLKANGLLKQRIIRNGWGGGRITPIYLATDQSKENHAATYIKEEQGLYDGLRARFTELLKNSDFSKKVLSNHPDLVKNTLGFANDFLGENRFQNIVLSHENQISLEKGNSSIVPWDGLSGGEQSAFSLAMAIEFEMLEPSQIVIFEEPETTVHPSIQVDFLKKMKQVFPNRQIIISTHSPYLFMGCLKDSKLLVTRKEKGIISVEDTMNGNFGLLKWSPSWGEINYFAYDIPSIEFHNDLYSSLQERENFPSIASIENWFTNTKKFSKEISWFDSKEQKQKNETLMTYIRHRIHHADYKDRPEFSRGQLKDSIERMISLLRTP